MTEAILSFFERIGTSDGVVQRIAQLLEAHAEHAGVARDGQATVVTQRRAEILDGDFSGEGIDLVCLQKFVHFLYAGPPAETAGVAPFTGLWAAGDDYILVKADATMSFSPGGEYQEITRRPVLSSDRPDLAPGFGPVTAAVSVLIREEDVYKLVGSDAYAQLMEAAQLSGEDCFVNPNGGKACSRTAGDERSSAGETGLQSGGLRNLALFSMSIKRDGQTYLEYHGTSSPVDAKPSGEYQLLDASRSQVASVKRAKGTAVGQVVGHSGRRGITKVLMRCRQEKE
eukprot:Skav209324  [mRNA]  locus=scaffold724:201196:209262:- [translate_table: standard]